MIPPLAIDAAKEAMREVTPPPGVDKSAWLKEHGRYALLAGAIAAAAPHLISEHLLSLARDARARGDIGKDGGTEAWDYLTFHAEKARANPYRSQT